MVQVLKNTLLSNPPAVNELWGDVIMISYTQADAA